MPSTADPLWRRLRARHPSEQPIDSFWAPCSAAQIATPARARIDGDVRLVQVDGQVAASHNVEEAVDTPERRQAL